MHVYRYPRGFRQLNASKVHLDKPTEVVRKAVYGMLPKNKLRNVRIARLLLFPDDVRNESLAIITHGPWFIAETSVRKQHSKDPDTAKANQASHADLLQDLRDRSGACSGHQGLRGTASAPYL